MFEASYQNLSDEHPEWGTATVLPWDTEIFGFAVAAYNPGPVGAIFTQRSAVAARLTSWAAERGAELISCAVGAAERRWGTLLPLLGFTHVESTLKWRLAKLQAARFPRKHTPVRLATLADQPGVERICETGFYSGRYHADARFPLPLASARYRQWLANEFDSLGESNRIYVAGEIGAPVGFTHARVNGEEAHITIGGADPVVQSSVLPFAVFIGTVEALRDSGIRRAHSKTSTANTPMINLASYAGFRFSDPESVFHWHAPHAPHLVSLESAVS